MEGFHTVREIASLGSPKPDPDGLHVFSPPRVGNSQYVEIHVISDFAVKLAALEGIANHMAGIPGRKAIVWYCNSTVFIPAPPLGSRLYY